MGRGFIIYHRRTIFSSRCRVGVKAFRAHGWQVSPSPAGHTAGGDPGTPHRGNRIMTTKKKRKKQSRRHQRGLLQLVVLFTHAFNQRDNYRERREQPSCRRGIKKTTNYKEKIVPSVYSLMQGHTCDRRTGYPCAEQR